MQTMPHSIAPNAPRNGLRCIQDNNLQFSFSFPEIKFKTSLDAFKTIICNLIFLFQNLNLKLPEMHLRQQVTI